MNYSFIITKKQLLNFKKELRKPSNNNKCDNDIFVVNEKVNQKIIKEVRA